LSGVGQVKKISMGRINCGSLWAKKSEKSFLKEILNF
jgi:hypothetical protein